MITHAVLGGDDAGMRIIERYLRAAEIRVIYATVDGHWVRPADAYRADLPPALRPDRVVWIGCAPAAAVRDPGLVVHRVDHHRPGDPGFGGAPVDYWPSSSIGQVVGLLARHRGWLPRWPGVRVGCARGPQDPATPTDGWQYGDLGWAHALDAGDSSLADRDLDRYPTVAWVSGELLLTAAADHCLGAAYAGQCPGVDPADLRAYRAQQRAECLAGLPAGRPERAAVEAHLVDDDDWPAIVEAAWAAAHADLTGRPRVAVGTIPGWPCDYHGPYHWEAGCGACQPGVPILVRDLRDRPLVEGHEVLAQAGEAGLYRLDLPGRPPKLGVIGAGEGTVPGQAPVIAFLDSARTGEVLGTPVRPETAYGDPVRGYAGVEVVP